MAAKRKTSSKPTSLRGRLLLDGGKLQGSWFQRAVVLICQHDAEGAFGLVLNRPTVTPIGEALVGGVPEPLAGQGLRVGGPVQPAALSYLHCEPGLVAGSVMRGVNLGHSLEDLLELAATPAPGRQLLVFAGYAGWSPGQLDEELARGSWLVHPATRGLVTDPDPATLWQRVLVSRGGLYRLLAEAPEDLASN